MAVNRDSNGYTFGFAIALVAVVGTSLALIATGLKPLQQKNEVIKQKMEILRAMLTKEEMKKVDRKNANEKFDQYIDLEKAVVLDINGNVKEGAKAFDVDIRKEYKDKEMKDGDRNYPMFAGSKDGKTIYIIPVVGKGLWGPIWGNLALGEDQSTIDGASFGHKGETPGLGAEISQPFFVNRWIGEKITNESGEFETFEIVKDGSGGKPKKVDGITGGTITSKGVEEMVNRCMVPYAVYFKNNKKS